MCGIVGTVLKYNAGFYKQTEDVFYQMLYADVLRGDDSTGIIAVEKDTTWHIAKEATEAAWFIPQFRNGNLGKAMFNTGKAMIGHNRKKTIGAIEDATAHPFTYGEHFAMVHNGTLLNHKDLSDTAVDSEALTIHLGKVFEEHGDKYKEPLEEALSKVRGAYALAMYDQKNHTVRLLRNAERPLFVAVVDNGWHFASEGGMLLWILSRNGYDISKVKIEQLPVHTLLNIDLETSKHEFVELTVKKATPPAMKITHNTGGNTTKSASKQTPVGITKSEFKRFRRRLLNTRLVFWIDDWVEEHFPATEEEGETSFLVMGESDTILDNHQVNAILDLSAFGIKSKELDGSLWDGWVYRVSWDQPSGQFLIYVSDVHPLQKLKATNPPVINANYIAEKLDEQERKTQPTHH